MQMAKKRKKEYRKIYVAVKHVPHTPPMIAWTKLDIAGAIEAHRNSLSFKDGLATVKGWVVYEMEIERSIVGLRREGRIGSFNNQ